MPDVTSPVSRGDIEAAAARIGRYIRATPVIDVDRVTLKLELLQHTGSFKARGAFNRVLTADVPDAGLVAASGGNHGAAIAFVARALGYRAEIFVPEVSPQNKRDRIAALGATVVVGGAQYDDAQAAANVRAAETGALLIHPFDHLATVAGAGTCGRELDRQCDHLDTVLVATGGGGLVAGTASWFSGSGMKVVSVEPEGSCCLHAALAAGEPVDVTVDSIAADSLGARRIGTVNLDCCIGGAVESVVVTDEAIRHAQRTLWQTVALVAEPGGAAAYAALLSGAYRPAVGERVAVVVCGANCDPATVARQ